MEKLIETKSANVIEKAEKRAKPSTSNQVASLVNSVKAKTKRFQQRKGKF